MTAGVVALEDLVEEFVGTVRDTTHRGADVVPGFRESGLREPRRVADTGRSG